MKNALIFVGKEFINNQAFINYVKREALRKITQIDTLLFLKEQDKNLFLDIPRIYDIYDNVLIVTSYESYPTVSKIIATIFEDNLIAIEEMVVPSKAKEIVQDSFLIGDKKKINVLRSKVLEKLPTILIESIKESINLYTFGLDRNSFLEKLYSLAKRFDVELTITKETYELYKISVFQKRYGDIAMFVQNAKQAFTYNLIAADNIFEYLIENFSISQKTITFAESCTGGLLSSMLTKIPGSSNIFKGSLVTYSNEIKHNWLGVREETLKQYGAVSEKCVEEMLEGAIKIARSDYAIAISGIAGPGGATPTKPVGLVVVGCRSKEEQIIKSHIFHGDRNYIQYQAAMYGIRLLFHLADEELF